MTNGEAMLIGTILAIPLIFLMKRFSEYLKKKQIIKLFRKEDETIRSKISSYLSDIIYHETYNILVQDYIASRKRKNSDEEIWSC